MSHPRFFALRGSTSCCLWKTDRWHDKVQPMEPNPAEEEEEEEEEKKEM